MGKTIDKDGHILVVGGAGSGKSAYVAIPTLRYFWDGRFLAVDIKGELAQKSGRKAAVFNPCNPDALGYDPFYFARNLPNPTAQMREIALTLVPKSPDIKDPFWIQAAQNILTGHLLVAHRMGVPFINALKKIQGVPPQRLLEIAAADERAAMFVMQYIDTKKETLAGIMSELSNYIIPFIGDPDLEASLTKENIITPNLLEEGTSIFLQIPEHRINQWKALITLVIQQFLTHFEQRPENNDAPILFLIDEFARFGKIEGIVDGLATLRSKKITICILVQSLAQLDALYGQEYRKIIADNCAYKVVLSATDADTQQYFSSLAGTELVTQESFTKDQKNLPWFGGPETISSTVSKVERAVIKPEAFAQLGVMNTVVVFSPVGMQTYIKQRYDKILGREPLV